MGVLDTWSALNLLLSDLLIRLIRLIQLCAMPLDPIQPEGTSKVPFLQRLISSKAAREPPIPYAIVIYLMGKVPARRDGMLNLMDTSVSITRSAHINITNHTSLVHLALPR